MRWQGWGMPQMGLWSGGSATQEETKRINRMDVGMEGVENLGYHWYYLDL